MASGLLNPVQLLNLNGADTSQAFGFGGADGFRQSASGLSLHSFRNIMDSILKRADSSSQQSDMISCLCNKFADSNHKPDVLASFLTDQCHSSGQSMAAVVVNPETLNDFSSLLHQAGFDPIEIEDAMESLQSRTEESKLVVSDLVRTVETLSPPDLHNHSRGDEILVEISSLPFLESILSRLGLEQNQIQEVTSDAIEEGRGINLSVLSENLQPLKERFFWNEQKGTAQDLQGWSKAGTEHLMRRIGMDMVDGKKTESLNTFVARLETIAGRNCPAATNGTDLSEEVQHLLQTTISPDEKKAEGLLNLFRESGDSRFSESKNWDKLFEKPVSPSSATGFSNPVRGREDAFGVQITDKKVFDSVPLARPTEALQNLLIKEGEAVGNIGSSGPASPNFPDGQQNFSGFQEHSAFRDKHFFTHSSNIVSGRKIGGVEINEENPMLSHSFSDTLDPTENSMVKNSVGTKHARMPQLPAESIAGQVGQKLRLSIPRGDRQLQLHLKPDHLGRIQLNINNTGDQVTVHIITEHESTRDVLLNHSGELKAALMEQGIRLDKVDVQSTFNFEQYTAHQQQQSNAFGGKRRNGRSAFLSQQIGDDNRDVDDISGDRHQREPGGLNIVA
jgi:hypothetical protein